MIMEAEKKHHTEDELEEVLKTKVEPIVASAMQRFIGVTIGELAKDLSAKLTKSPLIDFVIDTSVPFKQAKRRFKRDYLRKLLQINYGNVSEVARISGLDRRSIHRIINEAGIDVTKIRRDMAKAYEIKQVAVGNIIEDVLGRYKEILHPTKFDAMYRAVPELSRDILESLPDEPLTLKQAEREFEEEYMRKVLKDYGGRVPDAARHAAIRYETLHRKAKKLQLIS